MKQKHEAKPELIPLHELITALRILRCIKERLNEIHESSMYVIRVDGISQIESAIEAHGYKKFEGKFYKLSDFQLLSPLEV